MENREERGDHEPERWTSPRDAPQPVSDESVKTQVGKRLAERHADLKMRDVGPPQKILMAIGVPLHQEVVELKTTGHIEADLKSPHAKVGAANQSRH